VEVLMVEVEGQSFLKPMIWNYFLPLIPQALSWQQVQKAVFLLLLRGK
jgi:hypothetical protein